MNRFLIHKIFQFKKLRKFNLLYKTCEMTFGELMRKLIIAIAPDNSFEIIRKRFISMLGEEACTGCNWVVIILELSGKLDVYEGFALPSQMTKAIAIDVKIKIHLHHYLSEPFQRQFLSAVVNSFSSKDFKYRLNAGDQYFFHTCILKFILLEDKTTKDVKSSKDVG